jgi:hypothetical protein
MFFSLHYRKFCSLIRYKSAVFFLLLLLTTSISFAAGGTGPFAPIQNAASPVKKYMSAPIKSCVRIDMAGDAASEGLSAVFPVAFTDMKIVSETQKKRYSNFGLPPEGYDFVLKQGYWQLVNKAGVRAISYQLAFPPFSVPIFKSILRAANSGTYSDLNLDKELGVFGVTGWGIKGNDVSSLLRLPFKTSPGGQISSEKAILFMDECVPPDYDPEKFMISGADIAMAQGYSGRNMWNLVYKWLEDKRDYQKELMQDPPAYEKAVDILFKREISDRADMSTIVATCLDSTLRFSKDLKCELKLKSVTGSTSTTTPVKYRLSCWPFMEPSGYLTYSSLSEPGFGAHKGETMVYLTPLSLQSERLAALALKREMVRAVRTRWLLHGLDDSDPLDASLKSKIGSSLHESLLRISRPLWDNIAVNNAHMALNEGIDTRGDIPAAARIRINNNISETLQKVMRPDRNDTSEIPLDDHYGPAYPFPMRAQVDGWYSRAVYSSWQNWGDVVKTKTVDAVVELISNGFTRNTRDPLYEGYGRENVLLDFETASKSYFFGEARGPQSTSVSETAYTSYVMNGATDNKFQGKYGWDVLQSQFTDLEWLAQSIDPLDSGTTISEPLLENEANQQLMPLLLPFWHAREAKPMIRLANIVRGAAFGCPDKVVAVDGLPWTTNEPDIFCYVNDTDSIDKVNAICNAIISDPVGKSNSPAIPSTTYDYVTTYPYDLWSQSFTTHTSAGYVFEARRYFQHVAKKSMTDAIAKLRETAYKNSVGIVKSVNYGYQNKMGKFQTDWDSGSYEDLSVPLPKSVRDMSETSSAVIPTLCRLFGTINTFIDKTRYIQSDNDGNEKSWKAKNELFDKLKRDVLIKPSLVPQVLWQRYLYYNTGTCENGYNSFKSFSRRFVLAAHGLSAKGRASRKIHFMKPTSGGSNALTAIAP